MKKILAAAFGVCWLGTQAQVVNEVSVYVKPGTEVHVFENMTNAGSGNFTMGEDALLYVDGTLVNNGSMTFNNAASLLRGSTGSDGTGSGTYYVKRQGATSSSVFNFWSSPMTSYSGVPGNSTYLYDSNLSTQTFTDDQPADPGWISHSGLMSTGYSYAGRGGGLHTFNGDVNNGNLDIPMVFYPYAPSNTAGGTPFNLMGNPYPSAISCAALISANLDVNGAVYFWDDDLTGGSGYESTDYAVWNGTGSLGTGSGNAGVPNGYISTGQGFMIRALNGSAVLNFNNTMRVAHNNSQFFKASGDDSRLWLSLEGNDNFNQILVGVLEDATDLEDRLYDAVKIRGNTDIALAALDNDREYAITAFPPPSALKTIPLDVYVSQAGTYAFKSHTMEGFAGMHVFFSDLLTGDDTELFEGTEITVSLISGENSNRFYLNFFPEGSTVGLRETPKNEVSIYSNRDQLFIVVDNIKVLDVSVEFFDMGGRLVYSEYKSNLVNGRTTVPLRSLSDGIYVARLQADGKIYTQKILKN